MRMDIISFTQNGYETSKRIKELLQVNYECNLFCASEKVTADDDIIFINESVYEWSEKRFKEKIPVVFIGAMGIAVRAIAPSIKSKLEDIPVIVIDEKAEYVIPVLSGHVGGANDIAGKIAEALNARAVITTATDVNKRFSVDVFAVKNNLHIVNKDGIAKVSSKILNGQTINIFIKKENIKKFVVSEYVNVITDREWKNINADLSQKADVLITEEYEDLGQSLTLIPRNLVLGIGCKKGKSFDEIEAFVREVFEREGLDLNRIGLIASVDIKKEEDGIVKFSEKYKIPFVTFTSEELSELEGDFEESDFVMENVGVGNVCERSAVKASENDVLLVGKTKGNGITMAVSKKNWSVDFNER
ncbi:MAG: cobalt-precorrin 5A hydrolase [Lachnospiraceae bacterium]|nr:cobalt-precorrin 5A hydrolase [Lachnospiraceae bacterium]